MTIDPHETGSLVLLGDARRGFSGTVTSGSIRPGDSVVVAKSGKTSIFRSPSGMSNGLKFDSDGNMIAALGADYGGRMLIKTVMKTGKSIILTGLYKPLFKDPVLLFIQCCHLDLVVIFPQGCLVRRDARFVVEYSDGILAILRSVYRYIHCI